MIYHLIDTVKYGVKPHTDGEHVWIDFRNYAPNGDTRALVKDMIETDNFLRVVIKNHNPAKNHLFHVFQLSNGKKSFFITDAALNQFPSLDERLGFAIKTAGWALAHNQMMPDDIVWFLNHSGHFNLKNKTANESELLVMGYNRTGLSAAACGQLDVALSADARQIKDSSDTRRDARIIVVNDINEGNGIIKAFMLNNWTGRGFLIGADVPVVLNSRFNLDMNSSTLELLGVK